jgi:phage tail sheath gpL-like
MTTPVVISGFPSSNRVPGAYGEVLTGQGGQSAASLPLKCLVVALAGSGGAITPDTQVVQILSTADADYYAQAGSEGATMLYDALTVAGNAGVPLWYCSPKPANGATAATAFVKISGTATAQGGIAVRINGKPVSILINIGDTGAQACTNLANAIAGFNGGRLPLTASAATNYTTISCRTAGQRGMQHVIFLDTTQLPAGITASLYATWALTTAYLVGDCVIPKASPNGLYFKCTTPGTSSNTTEPTWPTTVGQTVTDGTVTWTCWGSTATGNVPTTAVFLGNATGLETYTNLLNTLASQTYHRIALAANDATSLAAWKTQIDQYTAAPYNFLQHAVAASNGTLAAAQSLYQTTLNDTSFNGLWEQNCETHPSRIAAAFAAVRAMVEQGNPNPNYDGVALTTVAPQTQPADWPTLPVLISAINNSTIPVSSRLGDGYSRIERGITTKSLTGGAPDYSTIDIGMRTVPDFVLVDGKLYWSSKIQPGNPVCQDDPPPGQRQPPSGVMTPSRAAALYTGKLNDYARGILSGTTPSVPPIVIAPLPGDVQGTWDNVALRIMLAENVRVMPIFHQIGISVRQVTP